MTFCDVLPFLPCVDSLYSLNRREADYLLQDVAWGVIRNKLKAINHFERPVNFLNVKCIYSSSRIIVVIFVKYVCILRKIINRIVAYVSIRR